MAQIIYQGEAVIRRTGMTLDRAAVELQTTIPPIIPWTTYDFPVAQQKEFLAIAMMAISTGRRVYCSISDPLNQPSSIPSPGTTAPAPVRKTVFVMGLLAD